MKVKLYNGDCLEVMKTIPDKSIDAIITDPPYGTTACKWDSVIDFDLMWKQLNRIIKDNGAIVLFGSQPFTSALIMSNVKNFKYEWVWLKNKGGNIFNVKINPMKQHENILIFGKGKTKFYPIKEQRTNSGKKRVKSSPIIGGTIKKNAVYGKTNKIKQQYNELRYPKTFQKFNVERGLHPTQKPVTLMEYLIKTYTNENETVLDFTMGSGTTGVACCNTNRDFIGIELDNNYFNIAKQRINNENRKS